MTDQHEKALRELIALAAKSSPMPWAIDPDDRPDMEWNNFIVQAARPHMTVCFMAHSGREDNSELEHAAEFIAKASQAIEALTALLDERERMKETIVNRFLLQKSGYRLREGMPRIATFWKCELCGEAHAKRDNFVHAEGCLVAAICAAN